MLISLVFMMSKKNVKYLLIKLIRAYQIIFSPDKGLLRYLYPTVGACNMYPTCSEYMILSIQKYGVLRGIFRGIRRILRCHPYQKKLIDLP